MAATPEGAGPALVPVTSVGPAKKLAALDVNKLSAGERAMTVEAYLKTECKKRTEQLVRHMENHVDEFERQTKRARTVLEDAARVAAVRGQDEEPREAAAGDDEEDAGQVFCLQGIKGPYAGEVFWMPSAPNTTARLVIGRSHQCDISLAKDDEISTKHARIDVKNNTFKLVDTNSTNGTFMNVEKLGRKAHPLRPGDTITVGASTFKWALVLQPEPQE
ncbi:SMAD/FHA domain-containing protein [Pavlovales sp. CCMP2436]|nr:SMAD/FHA domain-containing protein [Pavlovales sp. CCMP2436]